MQKKYKPWLSHRTDVHHSNQSKIVLFLCRVPYFMILEQFRDFSEIVNFYPLCVAQKIPPPSNNTQRRPKGIGYMKTGLGKKYNGIV